MAKSTNSKNITATTQENVQVKKTVSKKVTAKPVDVQPVAPVKTTTKKVLKKTAEPLAEEQAGKRYFKCVIIENDEVKVSGRYSGKKPKQAASKACTKLYEDQRAAGQTPVEIVFGMHECTRSNKKKKKYFYVGKREKLPQPEKVSINKIDPKTGSNMVITYHYNNDVKKLHDFTAHPQFERLATYDVREGHADVARVAKKTKKVVKKATEAKTVTAAKTVKVQRKAVTKVVTESPVEQTAAEPTPVPVKVKKTTKTVAKTNA